MHLGMFICFMSLRLCGIHLLLSASTWYVFYITFSFCLYHLYPTPSRNSFVFYSSSIFVHFFSVALISRVAFFLCALLPGTLALDLPTLIF